MTRRISQAILLTTWAVLIAGCLTAYFTVRWALIEQLDHALLARASTIPELAQSAPDRTQCDPTTNPTNPSSHSNLSTTHPATTTPAYAPAREPKAHRADPTTPSPNSAPAPPSDYYAIRTETGQTLSPPAGGLSATDLTPISASFAALPDGRRLRVLTLRGTARLAGGRIVSVTVIYQSSADQLDQLLNRLALTFSAFGLIAGLITALVAQRVSRAAMRPLYATAEVIGAIEPRHLDRRIDSSRLPPELLPMAGKLNEMLERIERAYAQRQQFLADASHELRTPVAAMVTTAEVTLRKPRSADEYQAALKSALDDARLLRRLVERLMEQCRADTLSHDEEPTEIDLTPLLSQCADHAAALGLSRNITVRRQLPPSCIITTQSGRVRSIITNLMANAVEHNRPAGAVELIASPNGRVVHLEIRDTGPGIAPKHMPYLFEPFYRVDNAGSHESGHMGLGLALVQAHIHALGGTIRCESTPGEGTIFHVDIPTGKSD